MSILPEAAPARVLFYKHKDDELPANIDLFHKNPLIEAVLADIEAEGAIGYIDSLTRLMLEHPDLPIKTTRAINARRPVQSTVEEIWEDHNNKLRTKMRCYPDMYAQIGLEMYKRACAVLQETHYNATMFASSHSFYLKYTPELDHDDDLTNAIINIVTAIKLRQMYYLDVDIDPFQTQG